MRPICLLDTGPLIALLAEADTYHDRALRGFEGQTLELITCWPVLTEAAYMLQKQELNPQLVIEFCEKADLRIEPLVSDDLAPIRFLLEKYATLRLQLADACLLRLADRLAVEHILTFDRRDFGAACTPRGRFLSILPADPS